MCAGYMERFNKVPCYSLSIFPDQPTPHQYFSDQPTPHQCYVRAQHSCLLQMSCYQRSTSLAFCCSITSRVCVCVAIYL